MPNILVAGAATGLGAEFVKVLCSDSKNHVFAVDRKAVAKIAENVHPIRVDIQSENDLNSLKSSLEEVPIDLLIYSVGVRGLVSDVENAYPTDVARAETLAVMNEATISSAFHINALGAFSFIKTVLPNLQKSFLERDSVTPTVLVMSSRMGSIGCNTAGRGYAYRASKAALNAIIRSFSVDVPFATFVLVHPGRVETQLTKCREEGAIEPEESVASMLKLIDFVGRPHSGKFLDRFGVEIPW